MRREPQGVAEADRLAALYALQDRKALVARNAIGICFGSFSPGQLKN